MIVVSSHLKKSMVKIVTVSPMRDRHTPTIERMLRAYSASSDVSQPSVLRQTSCEYMIIMIR